MHPCKRPARGKAKAWIRLSTLSLSRYNDRQHVNPPSSRRGLALLIAISSCRSRDVPLPFSSSLVQPQPRNPVHGFAMTVRRHQVGALFHRMGRDAHVGDGNGIALDPSTTAIREFRPVFIGPTGTRGNRRLDLWDPSRSGEVFVLHHTAEPTSDGLDRKQQDYGDKESQCCPPPRRRHKSILCL